MIVVAPRKYRLSVNGGAKKMEESIPMQIAVIVRKHLASLFYAPNLGVVISFRCCWGGTEKKMVDSIPRYGRLDSPAATRSVRVSA